MSKNNKQIFFSYEIIYNNKGQLILKKRLLSSLTINYYRLFFKGA